MSTTDLDCFIGGFGSGVFGLEPWGGSLTATPGGPLPTVSPFDVYCVGPCGPIAVLLSHSEVTTVGDISQFPVDAFTLDQIVRSGGSVTDAQAAVIISTAVPSDFTLEFTVNFGDLPNDFSDLVNRHIFIGVSDQQGSCAGLFFSKIGISYTGCVHESGGNLQLDTSVHPLENSQLLVSEDEYWTVRIAVSDSTETAYIYVTKTTELLTTGHQLRYVLPAIPSNTAAVPPVDRTFIAVRGTVLQPSLASFNGICLATGLIIPNIAPKADPGPDQAVPMCSVVQLDGSRSFDPEGAVLTYKWRLIDAPDNSQYAFQGTDGRTYPLLVPTGFTDKFHSVSLSVLHAGDPIVAGDVLTVGGESYNITGTGSDVNGFYVTVDTFSLPDSLSVATAFKFLRQRGINQPTEVRCTFYPDVSGFFKFDLTVFDGALFSEAASVVINVLTSVVARGVTPDLKFLWGYLSDFWNLVENKEKIEVFWGGLAQVAAAELLTLWQIEYNKSLRDVQRTFQRKWLSYSLQMKEDPNLVELTTIRAVWSGMESVNVPNAGINLDGTHLDLQLAVQSAPKVISFSGSNPWTAAELQLYLQTELRKVDTSIVVRIIPNKAGTASRLRIESTYSITRNSSSTDTLFGSSAKNALLQGSGGSIGVNTYRVDKSLSDLGLKTGDYLVLDGVSYRIARISDDPSDTWNDQRVTLMDDLPVAAGSSWSICSQTTSKSLDFFSGLVEQGDLATFEILDITTGAFVLVDVPVVAPSEASSSILGIDATVLGLYLTDTSKYAVFLLAVIRKTRIPIDPLVVDVPHLQENIKIQDDERTLRKNVDYFLETHRGQSCIRFVTNPSPDPDVWEYAKPPLRLWAEYTFLDNRPSIEANFGIPAEFTLDDLSELPENIDYLSSVRGLWYAYFNGPTVRNLRVGTQILLGLPFAEETGVITEIRDDFSATQGRILVQDVNNAAVVRSYGYPTGLELEENPDTGEKYKVGDTVRQLSPLVTGVEILDYKNNPSWFDGYLNQGVFYEVEKFFKFLVRVDSVAFNLNALLFVQTFVRRIKPTYTYPLFVVLKEIGDTTVSTTDDVHYTGTLHLLEGAQFNGTMGVSNSYDDARAAGGGWRGAYDEDYDPSAHPVDPTPEIPTAFGQDKKYLAPNDAPYGTATQVLAAPTPIALDGVFRFDLPTHDGFRIPFNFGDTDHILGTPGTQLDVAFTAAGGENVEWVEVQFLVFEPASPNTFNLVITKNGVTQATVPLTMLEGSYVTVTNITPFTLLAGDVVRAFLVSTTGNKIHTVLGGVLVTLGEGVTWALDSNAPAGTYRAYGRM